MRGHANQNDDFVTEEELLRLVEFLGLILKGPPHMKKASNRCLDSIVSDHDVVPRNQEA